MSRPIANAEMAAAWDGGDGDQWTEYEAHFNAGVQAHSRRLYAAARFSRDDRVLDIGCGTGESTRAAAREAAFALGIDLSARMLDRARERSREAGLDNVAFEQADAQVHPFPAGEFDVAMSRYGAMFFADRAAAFANIRSTLRPGGRLALLAWQSLADNEWLTEIRGALAVGRALPAPPVGAPGPFGLADRDDTATMLAGAGFTDIEIEPVSEAMMLGADANDAFGFLRPQGITNGLLNDLDDAGRAGALDALRAMLAAHETGAGVLLGSASWLITAACASRVLT